MKKTYLRSFKKSLNLLLKNLAEKNLSFFGKNFGFQKAQKERNTLYYSSSVINFSINEYLSVDEIGRTDIESLKSLSFKT
jgi:hypothetical protein